MERLNYGAQDSTVTANEARIMSVTGCSSMGGHEESSILLKTSDFESANRFNVLDKDVPDDNEPMAAKQAMVHEASTDGDAKSSEQVIPLSCPRSLGEHTAAHLKGPLSLDVASVTGNQRQCDPQVVDADTHAMVTLIAAGQPELEAYLIENLFDCKQTPVKQSSVDNVEIAGESHLDVATVQSQRILRGHRPLPTVWGTVNNKSVSMLIDTGAQVSIMSSALFRVAGGKLRDGPNAVRVASNTSVCCLGECTVDIALGSQVFTVDVLVLQNTSHPFLLGQDVLLPVKAQIHMSERLLKINGEEVPFARENWCSGNVVHVAKNIVLEPGMNIVQVQLIKAAKGWRTIWPSETLWKRNLYAEAALVQVDTKGKCRWAIVNLSTEPVHCRTMDCLAFWDDEDGQLGLSEHDVFTIEEDDTDYKWLEGFRIPELGLSVDQQQQLKQVLLRNHAAISKTPEDLGTCRGEECTIDTGDAKPVKLRWRRLAPIKQAAVDAEVDSLLKRGLIRPSRSPWAAPVVVVHKKNGAGGKRFRVCTDYRSLNQLTVKDSFPLPDVTRILEELNGNSWFSTLDLTSGYLQVPMAKEDQAKTAFTTKDGLYEYVVLPFGLTNAPAQFCRIMAKIFEDSRFCATVYMDDIVVRARTFAQSLEHLEHVLMKLAEAGLKVRPDKCKLLQRQVQFLGHVVSEDGVHPDPAKAAAVQKWPVPQGRKELSAFLGLCGYYQRFVPNFSTIAQPLHALMSQKVEWNWTPQCAAAFQELKERLVTPPVLGYPDFGKDAGEFFIDVDASDVAAGAVLSQVQNGQERVLAYGHKSFTDAQKRYCTTMKELCALVYFVRKYQDMVWGCHTTVRTDHQALLWLRKVHPAESMLERWYFVLEEALDLDCDVQSILESAKWTVQHRAGKKHVNADALSRQRVKLKKHHVDCPSCADLFVDGPDRLPKPPVVNAIVFDNAFHLVKTWQSEEEVWKTIIGRVQRGEAPPAPHEFTECSEEIQCLVRQWPRLTVVDGLLCWRNKAKKAKVVVPEAHRTTLLKLYHNVPGSLHEGASKMLSRIAEKFYWRLMQRDVQLYVFDCDVCTQYKTQRKVKEALEPLPLAYPNQRVHVDFLGPIQESAAGHAYIFVAVDAFSNYVSAWPTRGTSAVDAMNCLLDWFSLFGLCGWIHSDRGPAFEAELTSLICHQFGIQHSMSSAYHPQTNGKAEGSVKMIKKALLLHVKTFGTRWDVALKFALMSLRSGINTRTGVSPATLFIGREMRTMSDVATGVDSRELQSKKVSFATQVLKDLELVNSKVRCKLIKSQNKNKENFDKHVFSQPLKIGSRVLRWDHATVSRKAGYSGPYKVVAINSKRAHLNWEEDGADAGWASRDRLRLMGDDARWRENVDNDVWTPQRSHITVDGRKYVQKVGGGVHRSTRTANRDTEDPDFTTRQIIPRDAKHRAQEELKTSAHSTSTTRKQNQRRAACEGL